MENIKISYRGINDSKTGTFYNQRIRINRDVFSRLQDCVMAEIVRKNPRHKEYNSCGKYFARLYLKPLSLYNLAVCFLNITQRDFINLFLKLKLKDRNTCLIVDK